MKKWAEGSTLPPDFCAMNTLYIKNLYVRSGEELEPYLLHIPAVQQLLREDLSIDSPVTILVGENGSGKTTLLEAVAVASGFQAEGGSRFFNRSQSKPASNLHENLVVARGKRPADGYFLKAENYFQTISYVDETEAWDSYGGQSLHHRSHGEGFLDLVQNRFSGHGLYLLDEPEAALSPMRLLTLMVEISRLVELHSQFILATHSPILMAYPGAQVLQLDEEGIHRMDYRQTEHYQVTKMFLENPELMLHHLLDTSR